MNVRQNPGSVFVYLPSAADLLECVCVCHSPFALSDLV